MASIEKITDAELNQIVASLSKFEPGILPRELFYAVARLVPMPVVEMVPLRLNRHDEPEILMTRRDANDPYWPDKLHVPGTVLLETDIEQDHSKTKAFERIKAELGIVGLHRTEFVKGILHKGPRGPENADIFWTEMGKQFAHSGNFYPAKDLPVDVAKSQLDFIPDAIAHYLNHQEKVQ